MQFDFVLCVRFSCEKTALTVKDFTFYSKKHKLTTTSDISYVQNITIPNDVFCNLWNLKVELKGYTFTDTNYLTRQHTCLFTVSLSMVSNYFTNLCLIHIHTYTFLYIFKSIYLDQLRERRTTFFSRALKAIYLHTFCISQYILCILYNVS